MNSPDENKPNDARQGGKSATGEPGPQQVPPAGQPALDRPDGPPEVARGLFVGAALQVAEDDRRAILAGEAAQLLVHQPRLDRGPGLGVRVVPEKSSTENSRSAAFLCRRRRGLARAIAATRVATP